MCPPYPSLPESMLHLEPQNPASKLEVQHAGDTAPHEKIDYSISVNSTRKPGLGQDLNSIIETSRHRIRAFLKSRNLLLNS